MRSRPHVLQLFTLFGAIMLLSGLADPAKGELDVQSFKSMTGITTEASMDETQTQLRGLVSSVEAMGMGQDDSDTDIELAVDELLAEPLGPSGLANSATSWGDDTHPRSVLGAEHIELVSDIDLRKSHKAIEVMPFDADRSTSSIKSLLAADGWSLAKASSAHQASFADLADYQAFRSARSSSSPGGVTLLGLGGLVLFCSAGGGIALVYDRI